MLYNSKVYYYNVIFPKTNTAYMSDMVIYFKPMSHQSGVLTAFSHRLKTLQIAEVRAVQTPATLDGPTDRPSDRRDKANPL